MPSILLRSRDYQGQIVRLARAAEPLHFVENHGKHFFDGLLLVRPQNLEQSRLAELFSCLVGRFRHAVGINHQNVSRPDRDFLYLAVPVREQA